MQFKGIKGLADTQTKLITAIHQKHIAHAQLFFGNVGSANLALALAYAAFIHCEQPGENDSCGVCNSCKKHQKFIHPDLNFVFPVTSTKKVSSKPLSQDYLEEWRIALSKNPYMSLSHWLEQIGAENKQANISVEEGRNIIKTLSLKAYEGGYKIMLMWLPEFMNIQSANAILKILEEPRPNTLFLLVSQDYTKLLTTILSRVQMIQIPDFSDEEVQQNLEAHFEVSADQSKEIAYLADGNLNRAFELIQEMESDPHEFLRDWLRGCYKFDLKQLHQLTEQFNQLGKDAQKNLFLYGLSTFREALVFKSGSLNLIRASEHKLKFIQGFAGTLDINKMDDFYTLYNDAIYHLERNANAKIMFMDISLKLALLFKKN